MVHTSIQTEDNQLLHKGLAEIFGEFDQSIVDYITPKISWVRLHGGEYLFEEGDEGHAVYFLIRGRLLAIRNTGEEESQQEVLGEIARGEVVGEISIHSDEPRMASVMSVRDSVLVRVSRQTYYEVIERFPRLAHRVTKRIIKRLRQDITERHSTKCPATICVMDLHTSPESRKLIQQLQQTLQKQGTVGLVTPSIAKQALGVAEEEKLDLHSEKFGHWLDEHEMKHDFTLYLCESDNLVWTARCLRQADQVLLWANFTATPVLTSLEKRLNEALTASIAPKILILQHPAQAPFPRGTEEWLKNRSWLQRHFHIREDNDSDIPRLVRSICGKAIGLTLAGGGAKGFAHIGVLKALKEYNIPVDIVGGTSAGAMLASVIAIDNTYELTDQCLREAADYNPTKDLNFLPLVSLIKGKRIRNMISQTIKGLSGHADINVVDSWLPFYIVVSNLSKAREEVHTEGSTVKLLTASGAVPGVFPPVPMGDDLLVDGGNFNNFPVDVMRRMGAGTVIGVDFLIDKKYTLNFEETPDSWTLLRDKFRGKKRKYKMPSMTSIITNSSLLYSTARRKEIIKYLDLHFNPNVRKYGFSSWKAYDKIRDAGYEHAKEVLGQLPEEELRSLQA